MIEETITQFQKTRSEADFQIVKNTFEPLFDRWYNHVRKHLKIDKRALSAEFVIVVFRCMLKYDPEKKKCQNGFERYLKSACKKQFIDLIRQKSRHEKLPDWDLIDPKSSNGFSGVEVKDLFKSRITNGLWQKIIAAKLMGYNGSEIKQKMHLSHIQYKKIVDSLSGLETLKSSLSTN